MMMKRRILINQELLENQNYKIILKSLVMVVERSFRLLFAVLKNTKKQGTIPQTNVTIYWTSCPRRMHIGIPGSVSQSDSGKKKAINISDVLTQASFNPDDKIKAENIGNFRLKQQTLIWLK
jgi:hypothetical protein